MPNTNLPLTNEIIYLHCFPVCSPGFSQQQVTSVYAKLFMLQEDIKCCLGSPIIQSSVKGKCSSRPRVRLSCLKHLSQVSILIVIPLKGFHYMHSRLPVQMLHGRELKSKKIRSSSEYIDDSF